jgi:hypothetical protein
MYPNVRKIVSGSRILAPYLVGCGTVKAGRIQILTCKPVFLLDIVLGWDPGPDPDRKDWKGRNNWIKHFGSTAHLSVRNVVFRYRCCFPYSLVLLFFIAGFAQTNCGINCLKPWHGKPAQSLCLPGSLGQMQIINSVGLANRLIYGKSIMLGR